jgi:hypothetical protein
VKVTGSNPGPQPEFDSDISEMACFGELLRLCQSIPNAFKKNRALTMRYTNSVADFQALSETPRHKTGTKRHKKSQRVLALINRVMPRQTDLLRDHASPAFAPILPGNTCA